MHPQSSVMRNLKVLFLALVSCILFIQVKAQSPAFVKDFGACEWVSFGIDWTTTYLQSARGIRFYSSGNNTAPKNASIWRSDGTPAGTFQLGNWRTYAPVQFFSSPDSQAVFFALKEQSLQDGKIGYTDGSTQGTQILLQTGPMYSIVESGTAKRHRWILTQGTQGSPYYSELIVSDGTVAGTTILQTMTSPSLPHSLHQLQEDSTILFLKPDNQGNNSLWKAGTIPGSSQMIRQMGSKSSFVGTANGKGIYFSLSENVTYFSDGTITGTDTLLHLQGAINLEVIKIPGDSNLYLFYRNYTTQQLSMIVTDGTVNGTDTVATFPCSNNSPFPHITIERLDSLIYICSPDLQLNYIVYRSNGTSAGTWLMHAAPDMAYDFHRITGRTETFYKTTKPYNSPATFIWKTKDVPNSGSLVHFFAHGFTTYENWAPFIHDQKATYLEYYPNPPSGTSRSLYRSDGTAAGTHQIGLFDPGWVAHPHTIGVHPELFFLAYQGGSGTQLWKAEQHSDTTTHIFTFTKSLGAHFFVELVRDLVQENNKGYYLLNEGHHLQLWESDGTASGTILLKDSIHDAGYFHRVGPVNASDIYFTIETQNGHQELWRLNGLGVKADPPLETEQPSLKGNPGAHLSVFVPESWIRSGEALLDLYSTDGRLVSTQAIRSSHFKANDLGLVDSVYLVRIRAKGFKAWTSRWLKVSR